MHGVNKGQIIGIGIALGGGCPVEKGVDPGFRTPVIDFF